MTMTTYLTMTPEYLGPWATEADLDEFRDLCRKAHRMHPDLSHLAITEAVFGDGDYFRNAKRLGVN